MHLAIDIGNTSLKFALFDGETMSHRGSGVESLSALLDRHRAERAILTSVADSGTATALLSRHNIPYVILSHLTPIPIGNLYGTPETLGTDRICLAVAADHIFGGMPALVIAAGTCITYNFTEGGSFIGGAISPGIRMRFQALNHCTSQLPDIDWSPWQHEVFDGLTGHDTDSSIVTGVLSGVLHEVRGTIEQYRLRYSGLPVAVTGGDIDFLDKNLKNGIFARPDMVLEGLNYILMHHA